MKNQLLLMILNMSNFSNAVSPSCKKKPKPDLLKLLRSLFTGGQEAVADVILYIKRPSVAVAKANAIYNPYIKQRDHYLLQRVHHLNFTHAFFSGLFQEGLI